MSALIQAKHIKCYVCNSHPDAQGDECIKNPKNYEKDCTNGWRGPRAVGCLKIDQWIDYDDGPGNVFLLSFFNWIYLYE